MVERLEAERTVVPDSFDSAMQAIESCYQQGWTDGLPVVPPTESRVRAMLEHTKRDPHEVLGTVPPDDRVATVENVAINAVMAGCLPEYFPVVLAAVEAMLEPSFNLHWMQLSTGGTSPLAIVSGPLARELGINSGTNVFGGGFRANATIGRAIRLVLWNVGGSVPDVGTKAVMGHPGNYTFCIAERDDTPWEPLHVERGFGPEDTCVTMVAVASYHRSHGFLSRIAAYMAAFPQYNFVGLLGYTVVLSPQIAWLLKKEGWSKDDVRQYLYQNSMVPAAELMAQGGSLRGVGAAQDTTFISRPDEETKYPRWVDPTNPASRVPVARPENILIVVAGGAGFGWCATLTGNLSHSRPVTRRVS
ncbi:MAG: hypothetical protein HYY01_11765 [Chloroflexi bacterium]|nr:hypothetical protein [Chloroflexota bacterium]